MLINVLEREIYVATIRINVQDLAHDLLTFPYVISYVLYPPRRNFGDVN